MASENSFDPFYISTLVVKMINSELTVAEQAELDEWLNKDMQNRVLMEKFLDKKLWVTDLKDMNAFDSEAALQTVLAKINQGQESKAVRHRTWPYFLRYVAAAIIVISGISIFYVLNHKTPDAQHIQANTTEKDRNKVMLTLADGSQVEVGLNGAASPIQQGVAVLREKNGTLTYDVDESKTAEKTALAYNTLTVPMGKQYQVTLPDGTLVWLNAHSSLKYPVAFNTDERQVELTGEAYFEVVHLADKPKPFKVKSAGQVVEVLGTHFNIEAYPDDKEIKTTLMEGSVQISKGKSIAKLKPGQMTVNSSASSVLEVQTADVTAAIAWKKGLFSFSDDRLEDIMKKVSRTYNVEVEFQGEVKDKRFWGVFPQDKGLKSLLKNLEQTKTVHFKVVGRRVIVMP